MKAYIFAPADVWQYCGGGLVITAQSFERAVEVFNEHDKKREEQYEKSYGKNYGYKPPLLTKEQPLGKGIDIWVLEKEILTTYEKEEILLYDFNYS